MGWPDSSLREWHVARRTIFLWEPEGDHKQPGHKFKCPHSECNGWDFAIDQYVSRTILDCEDVFLLVGKRLKCKSCKSKWAPFCIAETTSCFGSRPARQ